MDADTQAQVAFFLTGARPGTRLDAVDGLNLKPALFAGYRNLSELRYDFPLVLVGGRADGTFVQSLSGVVDRALAAAAQGSDGERLRKHVLRLEQEIRTLAAGGTEGTLSTLWDMAAHRVDTGADSTFADSVRAARAVIDCDGDVVDCDAALPSRVLQHAWRAVQAKKSAEFRKEIDTLRLKLSNILRADFERSEAGRSAVHLKASVGDGFGSAFDFDAMSRILGKAMPKDALPESRRARIEELLDVLNAQRFFPASGPSARSANAPEPYEFLFDRCEDAVAAFRARMPKVIELARAMAIAELEIDSQYIETRHDPLFAQFGANGLDPRDLAPFPDYLVCVNAAKLQPIDFVQLTEILASQLPIKILLQIDDILEESPTGEGNLTAGMRIRQLASMAMGLNEAYVVQSSSANLFRLRDRILRGLGSRGPALFSVFSGASGVASGLSPYLVSAAATESRAFPAFTYDPTSGPNWASRFSLDANTQVDLDWPVQEFAFEDENHQRVSEEVAFTVVDFVASDRRHAKHLARVPRANWNGGMVPVDQFLSRDRQGVPDTVPTLMMVDDDNVMHKTIVDERLVREARRCREMWHSLQELGGVHNSHAETLLARERKAWEERSRRDAASLSAALPETAGVTPMESVAAADVAPPAASAPVAPERSPDEAYIETARCSTCNECTTINGKMFAYNDNRQAYVADVTAGTYAQLVEAAESCQVSIIHPGKPRNPDEPGLERLMERAAAFA